MRLKELENKHIGKIGFVVGAGPSLHDVDFSLLKDHVTIAVNSAILKSDQFDYFVSDDQAVRNWQYFDDLKYMPCICLLFHDKLKCHSGHISNRRKAFFDHKCWYSPSEQKHYPEGLILTKDAKKPIIGARTSSGTALHLAYIMGCDPIVLLGSDCCFKRGRRYFWQFKGEKKARKINGGIPSFPMTKARVKGECVDKNSLDFLDYWEALAEQTKKQNINIINSSDGILDVFPRISLNKVLDRYG